MSNTLAPPRATLADLARETGKAELIAGTVVLLRPTGHRPNVVAGRIFRRLADHVDALGRGVAYTDNMGFAVTVPSTDRESFSPDVAYYTGPLPTMPMRFVEGPPDFAVEVRSEGDYGPLAEIALAAKRAEYFEAGTLVVWDVDPVASVIFCWTAGEAAARTFGPGEEADAEPAVPGWRLNIDWVMA